MARTISDEDVEAIAECLIKFSGLSNEEHKKQHDAFAIYVEKQTASAIYWAKIRQQVGGWLIIALLSGLGYGVWHGFLSLIEKGPK